MIQQSTRSNLSLKPHQLFLYQYLSLTLCLFFTTRFRFVQAPNCSHSFKLPIKRLVAPDQAPRSDQGGQSRSSASKLPIKPKTFKEALAARDSNLVGKALAEGDQADVDDSGPQRHGQAQARRPDQSPTRSTIATPSPTCFRSSRCFISRDFFLRVLQMSPIVWVCLLPTRQRGFADRI